MPTIVDTHKIKMGEYELVLNIMDDGKRVYDPTSYCGYLDYLAGGGKVSQADKNKLAHFKQHGIRDTGDKYPKTTGSKHHASL